MAMIYAQVVSIEDKIINVTQDTDPWKQFDSIINITLLAIWNLTYEIVWAELILVQLIGLRHQRNSENQKHGTQMLEDINVNLITFIIWTGSIKQKTIK